MKKEDKKERRTIVGRIASISPERSSKDGEPVVNIDIEVPGQQPRLYVELACWGLEGIAVVKGKRLNEEMSAWEQYQPALRVGLRVRVTGTYTVKTWKPTKSKKLGKSVSKGSINVYGPDQVKVITLPTL